LLPALLTLAACGAHNQANVQHNTDRNANGFTNSDGSQQDKPFSELLKWQWERFKGDLPQIASQQSCQCARRLDRSKSQLQPRTMRKTSSYMAGPRQRFTSSRWLQFVV
jgi:hypothetical protein